MSVEIDRWIGYMKRNPDTWKQIHTEFINAQFSKAREFIKRLSRKPGGKQKIIDAYNIKNMNSFSKILQ
ncbi:MAG: hypothetical protein ABIG95_01045 [Candidatus Woesearchaeota archaeon]